MTLIQKEIKILNKIHFSEKSVDYNVFLHFSGIPIVDQCSACANALLPNIKKIKFICPYCYNQETFSGENWIENSHPIEDINKDEFI
jgi:hypothetical protein